MASLKSATGGTVILYLNSLELVNGHLAVCLKQWQSTGNTYQWIRSTPHTPVKVIQPKTTLLNFRTTFFHVVALHSSHTTVFFTGLGFMCAGEKECSVGQLACFLLVLWKDLRLMNAVHQISCYSSVASKSHCLILRKPALTLSHVKYPPPFTLRTTGNLLGKPHNFSLISVVIWLMSVSLTRL